MATVQGSFTSDVIDVASAGTAVAIGASTLRIITIIFINPPTNTGLVYIGNKTGDVSATTGFPLGVGDTLEWSFVNRVTGEGSIGANEIFVDAAVSGNDVAWAAHTALAAR